MADEKHTVEGKAKMKYLEEARFLAETYTQMLDVRDSLRKSLEGNWTFTKAMAIAELDNIAVSYDGERVQSSNISNPTERIAMKITDEYMEKRQAEMDAERQACAMELDYVLWKIEVVETSSKERLTKKQGDVFTLIYVGHKTYHEAERIVWKKRKRKLVDRNIAATKQAILKALSTELELRCDCLNEGEYILRLQRELEECNYG